MSRGLRLSILQPQKHRLYHIRFAALNCHGHLRCLSEYLRGVVALCSGAHGTNRNIKSTTIELPRNLLCPPCVKEKLCDGNPISPSELMGASQDWFSMQCLYLTGCVRLDNRSRADSRPGPRLVGSKPCDSSAAGLIESALGTKVILSREYRSHIRDKVQLGLIYGVPIYDSASHWTLGSLARFARLRPTRKASCPSSATARPRRRRRVPDGLGQARSSKLLACMETCWVFL